MENQPLKLGIAGLGGIAAYLTGIFSPLFFIMVIFEILDYITGIIAAIKTQGGVSSAVAVWGFVKKVGYFVLVGVAFLFDLAVVETARYLGVGYGFKPVFGIMAVCYLLSTEGISILENLEQIDVSVPFLSGALKIYREKIAKKGE